MFYTGMKAANKVDTYNLYRGITDFGNLAQFDTFESGHSFISILQKPEFLVKGSDANKEILKNACYIIEREFKGLDGLDDMSSETFEINDGLNTMQLINKVKEQSSGTVTMRFDEKSGAPLTKFNELFLRGIYDPRSGFKHYHGLLEAEKPVISASFANEVFTMLYWVTDSTGLSTHIEKAFLLLGAQPTKAELNIYNSTKGEHDKKEVGMEFNCFVATGQVVNEMAAAQMNLMKIVKNAADIRYTTPQVSGYTYPTTISVPAQGFNADTK